MRLVVAAIAACCAAASSAAPLHPTVAIVDAATITSQCAAKLAEFRARKAAMESRRSSTGVFDEWNRLSIAQDDFTGPINAATNLSTDPATRDAADACTVALAPFTTELFQSEWLYARVRNAKPVDAVQREYRDWLIENFEDTGVTLPVDKRARVQAINDRLTAIGVQFDRNVRDDATTVVLRPDEMAGLSDAYLAAQKRDEAGDYALPLSYPAYFPFMEQASNADARRRYWLAMASKGGAQNLPLLDEAVRLRRELAGLYGDPDFATYSLRRKMAGSPQAVHAFLDSVRRAVVEVQARDLAALRQVKVEDTGQADARLERWDTRYYDAKLRRARFGVDQEALRRYFPSDASVAYVMKVASTLYGIRFEPRDVPVWHPSAKSFDVYEAADGPRRGAYIGSVYLDLVPRDGKYGHAHAESARNASTLARRTPIGILVANLDAKGLDQDELVTLMHEFGHVMHITLSKGRYLDRSGTNVRLDFVEAPSQMFEEWARREEALELFSTVCAQCPQLTHAQIADLEAARRFGQGDRYARQLELAEFDLALSVGDPPAALDAWIALERAAPLGYVPGSLFPANFTHLMDGYAAGYYGYMWSEVLALDMLSGFHGRLMNPVDGARYRADVLSQGAQAPPERLVERFLGRKPNSDAFFKEIVGER